MLNYWYAFPNSVGHGIPKQWKGGNQLQMRLTPFCHEDKKPLAAYKPNLPDYYPQERSSVPPREKNQKEMGIRLLQKRLQISLQIIHIYQLARLNFWQQNLCRNNRRENSFIVRRNVKVSLNNWAFSMNLTFSPEEKVQTAEGTECSLGEIPLLIVLLGFRRGRAFNEPEIWQPTGSLSSVWGDHKTFSYGCSVINSILREHINCYSLSKHLLHFKHRGTRRCLSWNYICPRLSGVINKAANCTFPFTWTAFYSSARQDAYTERNGERMNFHKFSASYACP